MLKQSDHSTAQHRPENRFVAHFEQNEPRAANWLLPARRDAIARFSDLGFPNRFDEEWRFTNISPIVETAFEQLGSGHLPASDSDLDQAPFANLGCPRIVFVNGIYQPQLSTTGSAPRGIDVRSLSEAIAQTPSAVQPYLSRLATPRGPAFSALNMALFTDGAFIGVHPGAVIEDPIQVFFLTTSGERKLVTHPRVLIVAGENSQATIVETYVGLEGETYLTNAVTEVFVGNNAVLDHYKLQQESVSAYHIANMQIDVAKSCVFSSHSISLGGGIVRNDIGARLNAEGSECTLNGLYLANGSRLVDNHTVIDHAMPHCDSHEVYRGILDGRAKGVFNGKIFVRQDAQKTDAKQTNKTLLLSPEAQINTKPQLEIFADDVKCTHGATVGQLDDEQVFYLRTRGIGRDEARNLLVYAFAADVISRIKVASAREALDKQLFVQLAKKAPASDFELSVSA